ncbi:MAG: hypothetical protein M1814_002807 [Vezdaea aestivalis]|nr:MAG: hypothetical protein M1814_002807 [Vezdaea aestivalis]
MSRRNRGFLCPLCDFKDELEYVVQLHVESLHSEADPPRERQTLSEENGDQFLDMAAYQNGDLSHEVADDYVKCPDKSCGEHVLRIELDTHKSMHLAERLCFEDEFASSPLSSTARTREARPTPGGPSYDGLQAPSPPKSFNAAETYSSRTHEKPEQRGLRSFKQLVSDALGPSTQPTRRGSELSQAKVARLGKKSLGPYAYEAQMPHWLMEQLRRGGKVTVTRKYGPDGAPEERVSISNETTETLLVIAKLSDLDPEVTRAYFCHPGVVHVSKQAREGSFCGYRNIQMMISYIQASQCRGSEAFPERIPGVLELQDIIENAWSVGINSASMIETGGIKGTRKYIGTPEAQATFIYHKIGCEVKGFIDTKDKLAYIRVLDTVEDYFRSGCLNRQERICKTWLPPLYFQFPGKRGHSLTIIGFERRGKSRNLVVFDPSYNPPKGIRDHAGRSDFEHPNPHKPLLLYRKTEDFLKKYKAFEILQLTHAVEQAGGKVWAKKG